MYRLLDLRNFHHDVKIHPERPTAVLDTVDLAISAITRDGSLVYCNRAFLQEHRLDRYGLNTSLRESVPGLWERFKHRQFSGDESVAVFNLYGHDSDGPDGHLLVCPRAQERQGKKPDLLSLVSVDDHPDFINSYTGLYVANPEADTIRVNPAYEKIAFLSENDLVGRNLAELVEKGYFSKSVTLSLLDGMKEREMTRQTFFQSLSCGKDVLVTGKPVFTEKNKLSFIVTFVQDLLVLDVIARKCREYDQRISIPVTAPDVGPSVSRCRERRSPDNGLVRFDKLPFVARAPLTISSFKQVARAAAYDSPILLTGETGVGKDVMAKYIHLLSSRRGKVPFINVNCSAIPGDLLESELFGYEAGAFSGARRGGKEGLFAAANGGIIFLNEISEIPRGLQAKLLTALDDGEVRPLGSSRTRKVRARIICATNRDLQQCIESGTFRSDLYYRIKVLTIRMGPLRERKEDILPLVKHFMTRLSDEYGLTRFLSPEVQEILLEYQWPGNVRELRNVVEQLMIYSMSPQVCVGDLPDDLLAVSAREPFEQILQMDPGQTLKTAVLKFEQYCIRETLKEYPKTSDAAKYLGIDPTTLSRKLKKNQ